MENIPYSIGSRTFHEILEDDNVESIHCQVVDLIGNVIHNLGRKAHISTKVERKDILVQFLHSACLRILMSDLVMNRFIRLTTSPRTIRRTPSGFRELFDQEYDEDCHGWF